MPKRGTALPAREPFSHAKQAEALYERTGAGNNPQLSSCTALSGLLVPTVSPGAIGPVGVARPNNYGGLNSEVNPAPYYDPRTISIRAPVQAVEGCLVTAPSLPHGPAPFFPDVGPPRVKTQYAPTGKIQLEPLKLTLSGELCRCTAGYPYSLESLMLESSNVVRVRDMLEAEGLVKVTRRLRALEHPCACAVFGKQELYDGFATFAGNFMDTSVAMVLDPCADVAKLNRLYVDEVMGTLRASVVDQSRMNYLRAEGPRAYLQDRPRPEDEYACDGTDLPPVLPGTGCRTTPEDNAFAARALTDPTSRATWRAAFSCRTGLPIGTAPVEIDSSQNPSAVEGLGAPGIVSHPRKPFCL